MHHAILHVQNKPRHGHAHDVFLLTETGAWQCVQVPQHAFKERHVDGVCRQRSHAQQPITVRAILWPRSHVEHGRLAHDHALSL
eukprot:65690-Prymnesium_polylepis.1